MQHFEEIKVLLFHFLFFVDILRNIETLIKKVCNYNSVNLEKMRK